MPERANDIARLLRECLLWGLHAGTTHPGDRFPSVRDIAERYSVDPRTALRACRILVGEGLLEMRNRSGTYVASQWLAAPPAPCDQHHENPLVALFVEGLRHGIPPARLPLCLADAFLGRPLRLACVGASTEDAVALCAMVSADFAAQPFALAADDLSSHEARQQLGTSDGVVTTVFQLQSVRRAMEPAQPPVFLAIAAVAPLALKLGACDDGVRQFGYTLQPTHARRLIGAVVHAQRRSL